MLRNINLAVIDYWDKDPNDWEDQNSYTALAEELKCLNKIYMGIYPACKIISGLQNELKESIVIYKPHTINRWYQRTPWLIRQQYVEKGIAKSDENKKIWDTKYQIASLAMESELTSKELEVERARKGKAIYP
ncbi:1726_t:CDS:2, partial [Rhizophagus irregularis]